MNHILHIVRHIQHDAFDLYNTFSAQDAIDHALNSYARLTERERKNTFVYVDAFSVDGDYETAEDAYRALVDSGDFEDLDPDAGIEIRSAYRVTADTDEGEFTIGESFYPNRAEEDALRFVENMTDLEQEITRAIYITEYIVGVEPIDTVSSALLGDDIVELKHRRVWS